MPIFRRDPPVPPEEPRKPSPNEPEPEPERPRALNHKTCGGIAGKHCAHPDCTWRVCPCGMYARLRWDGDLAAWKARWVQMVKR